MLVKDFLQTEIVTVNESATVGEVAALFLDTDLIDIGVVNPKGDFAGVISQADLLRTAMPDVEQIYQARVSYLGLNLYFLESVQEKADTPIARSIIRDPHCLSPDDAIVKAATIMINYQIASLPVVEDKKLLGFVTRKRILGLLAESAKEGQV